MELKLDVKTLVIGIAIGIVVTTVIGAGSSDEADFGIAIPSTTSEGTALVRTADDALYIVSARSGMAVRVLQGSIKSEPGDRRDTRSRPFSLKALSEVVKKKY